VSLTEQLALIEVEEGEGKGERILRSEHRVPLVPGDETTTWTRKRKPLTPQQLEERRQKVSGHGLSDCD
jgi:hypothetical protein